MAQFGEIKSWLDYTNNPRPKTRQRGNCIVEIVQSGMYASQKGRNPNGKERLVRAPKVFFFHLDIVMAPMNALTGSITTTLKYPDTNARQREVGIHEQERAAKPVTPDHAVH